MREKCGSAEVRQLGGLGLPTLLILLMVCSPMCISSAISLYVYPASRKKSTRSSRSRLASRGSSLASWPPFPISTVDQSGLARIVQQEARENDRRPGKADCPGAEMAHVRVKGFGTHHAQEDPSEDEKSSTSAGEEIAEPMPGVDREKHRRIP